MTDCNTNTKWSCGWVAGFRKCHTFVAPYCSKNSPDFQHSWESKMEPSLAIIQPNWPNCLYASPALLIHLYSASTNHFSKSLELVYFCCCWIFPKNWMITMVQPTCHPNPFCAGSRSADISDIRNILVVIIIIQQARDLLCICYSDWVFHWEISDCSSFCQKLGTHTGRILSANQEN